MKLKQVWLKVREILLNENDNVLPIKRDVYIERENKEYQSARDKSHLRLVKDEKNPPDISAI